MLQAGLQQPLSPSQASPSRPRTTLRGRLILWIWLALALPVLAQSSPVDQAVRAALEGDLGRAESLLSPADNPEQVMALGLVRQLQLRLEEAADLYQSASPAYPAEAAFRLGNLELLAGREVQAAVRYRQALQVDPTAPVARYNLALATGTSPGPYDQPAGWCLVRHPIQTRLRFLELRSENLLQAAYLARGEDLQAACEFTREPDPQLWLRRARIAPPARRQVLAWRYLISTLEATGRDADLVVWGPGLLPGGKSSLTFGVLAEGAVVDIADGRGLGLRVPPDGHALRVGPDGTARVWVRNPLPTAIGRIELEGPGRLASGYRTSHPAAPGWELVAPALLPYLLESPFLSQKERQARLEPLLEQTDLRLFVLQELGSLALQQGDLALAERHWQAALAEDPEWEATRYNLATLHLLQRRYEAARQVLDELQRLLPGSRVAYQERLRLAVLLQNPYEALAICRAYGERFPHDPYPAYVAGEILAGGERLEPALELARSLVQSHPELTEPRYLLASLLGRSGQTRAQIEQLEWLLEHDPWPYRAQRMLAANFERMGVAQRARDLYREYLGSYWPILFEPATYLEIDQRLSP